MYDFDIAQRFFKVFDVKISDCSAVETIKPAWIKIETELEPADGTVKLE